MTLSQPTSRGRHAASAVAVLLVAALVLLVPHHGVAARRMLDTNEGGVDGSLGVLSALTAHPAEGSTFSVEAAGPSDDYASPAEADSLSALDGVARAAATTTPTLPPPPPFLDANQPAPMPDQVKGDFMNCSGYAQPRTYIEGQAWFTPDSADPDAVNTKSMHLHVGACVPHRQWVAGVVKLAILVQRHAYNLPDSTPVTLKAEVEQKTSTGAIVRMTTFGKMADDAWDCSTASDLARLCKRVFYMDVQTSTWNGTAADGLNTLRLIGLTAINDTKSARTIESRIVSNFVLWNNQAVKPAYPSGLSNTLAPLQLSVTGHPWAYTHSEYQSEVPMAPIKGNLTFKTAFLSKTNTANVTGVFIAIDPAFHVQPVNFGTVLRSYGPQQPTPRAIPNAECPVVKTGNVSHIDCNKMAAISFNTTALADNKWHKIFIRVDSFVASNDPIITTRSSKIGGGTFSAVTLLAFRVNNTGNVIGGPVVANATAGAFVRPPSDFTPPEGVTVFGNQSLPTTNTTLNIAASNYNCSGDSATWLEPRVYLEGGSMFARPEENLNYGNNSALLVGACLPHGQRVAGKIPVDILLQKRNFPADSGLSVVIRLQLDWSWGNVTYRLSQSDKRTNWTCATPGNCRSIVSVMVDTKPADGKYIAPDGPQAVTVEAETNFNWGASSHMMVSRVHSWLFLTNNVDTNVSIPLNTSGSARLEYPFGNGNHWTNFTRPLPLLTPIRGVNPLSFVVSSPINITNMVLAVNPVWGPISDRGMVLATGSRITTNNKTLCSANNRCSLTNTPLDSTKLCNGVHRLVLRSDCYVPPQPAGTPLAVYGTGTWASYQMAPFTVANPTQSATCVKSVAAASVRAASASASSMGVGGGGLAARNRLYRAYRLAPERVVMAAAPRMVQELEVESYNNAGPASGTR